MDKNKIKIRKITILSLMIALCYIGFQFLRIDIPLPSGSTAIHLGNSFCVLAALLLGGMRGGLAGAIGMSIADLMIPMYAPYAPQTFLLKLMIGLITGGLAHKVFKITHQDNEKKLGIHVFISSIIGMSFNVVFDPIVSYFYKTIVLNMDADVAKIFATWTAGTSFINAITSVIIASLLYLALRRAIKNKSFFAQLLHDE